MKNKQNLHIHTTYADGRDTPKQMIEKAIERGFDSIGFSEHSYSEFSLYPHQMTVADMEIYKQEICNLKKEYKGIIDIFCGLEFEMYSDVDTDGFDYLIGSVHYLDANGNIETFDNGLESTLDYINRNFQGDGLAFAKKYYETVVMLPQKRNFDILGHFDLVIKNNDKGGFVDVHSKEYLDYGLEAIHALKGKIPFFEVNTGAISHGYRKEPYPQMEFLKEFKNLGFGVLITSDCHNREFIDCYYEQARELIAQAGFKSRWILTEGGFVEVSI